jgi:hypothetical protein
MRVRPVEAQLTCLPSDQQSGFEQVDRWPDVLACRFRCDKSRPDSPFDAPLSSSLQFAPSTGQAAACP